jgi:hypothetical protein
MKVFQIPNILGPGWYVHKSIPDHQCSTPNPVLGHGWHPPLVFHIPMHTTNHGLGGFVNHHSCC